MIIIIVVLIALLTIIFTKKKVSKNCGKCGFDKYKVLDENDDNIPDEKCIKEKLWIPLYEYYNNNGEHTYSIHKNKNSYYVCRIINPNYTCYVKNKRNILISKNSNFLWDDYCPNNSCGKLLFSILKSSNEKTNIPLYFNKNRFTLNEFGEIIGYVKK